MGRENKLPKGLFAWKKSDVSDESDLVRASVLYRRACRDVARSAMAAISSLAAEADSIVTVLLFSFCRWQGTSASSTISIWRLQRYAGQEAASCRDAK